MIPRFRLDEVPIEALITVAAIIGVALVLIVLRVLDWLA